MFFRQNKKKKKVSKVLNKKKKKKKQQVIRQPKSLGASSVSKKLKRNSARFCLSRLRSNEYF